MRPFWREQVTPPAVLDHRRQALEQLLPSKSRNLKASTYPKIDIPVAHPLLPATDTIIPYLREIDTNRWYSNQGPLCEVFQARLGRIWGMETSNVALVTSATAGLTLALRAQNIPEGSSCIMPSWTFIASAAAVTAAGLIPHFVDVLPDTWIPDAGEVERLAYDPSIGAVLIVAPFGAPLDLAVWDDIAARTGKPVIVDAAAAFDTIRNGGPMPIGQSTVVVSLHATKTFGIGEGGAVISRDPILAERIRSYARFGFIGGRAAQYPGVNAKISEYTAAVGLAGLDGWSRTRQRWETTSRYYTKYLPKSVILTPSFGSNWVGSTLTVLCPGGAKNMAAYLAERGIGTVAWWSQGCHEQPAYTSCPRELLPVTKYMGQHALGLPFCQDMSRAVVEHVCRAVAECVEDVSSNDDIVDLCTFPNGETESR
ncbi:DegT/DnrJ/EryC1/StrS family aminotransferase [Acetobacter sp.]|uniref:DegT/DnrJ/EryC1/StrS family aminotransferase n=1 Tax=Acetobacter sp. TaxID=440 RepID=UPI0039EA5C0D